MTLRVGDVDHPVELHDQHRLLAVHLGIRRGYGRATKPRHVIHHIVLRAP